MRLPRRQGFLKSAGLASLAEAHIENDPKKGDFYVALIEKPGRDTAEVLAEILPPILHGFPWPKSMRWGPQSAKPRRFPLGPPASCDPCDLRSGDRRAGDRPLLGRRDRGRQRHLWPSVYGAGPNPRAPLRRLCELRSKRRKWFSIRPAGATSSFMTPAISPMRRGSNLSRMLRSSRRSRASSNGRWC